MEGFRKVSSLVDMPGGSGVDHMIGTLDGDYACFITTTPLSNSLMNAYTT